MGAGSTPPVADLPRRGECTERTREGGRVGSCIVGDPRREGACDVAPLAGCLPAAVALGPLRGAFASECPVAEGGRVAGCETEGGLLAERVAEGARGVLLPPGTGAVGDGGCGEDRTGRRCP